MFNPLDLEKDDAEFVKATTDLHERDMKITRLTISRNLMLMAFLAQSFFLMAALLLSPRHFFSQAPLQMGVLALNAISFSHQDIQIKLLKASR